jgi:hypothetical protein
MNSSDLKDSAPTLINASIVGGEGVSLDSSGCEFDS